MTTLHIATTLLFAGAFALATYTIITTLKGN
jgi:hypothetical protein